jgi:FAD-linked oxidoreductase
VRALGAGHSFSPLSETNGTLISLDDFSGLVAVSAADSTASARAGTRIHALGRALFDAGVALKNQGDIDRQSLAGAVGTGTHGTGPTLGSLSAEVSGFRLVTVDGQVLECSPATNADVWQAGRVSFGSLGVMSEITFAVRSVYKLRERTWLMPAAECWRDLEKWRDRARHFEFFLFPYADTVLAKSLTETDEECPPALTAEQLFERGEVIDSDQRAFHVCAELARLLPFLSGPMQRFFARAAGSRSPAAPRWSHEAFPSARNIKFNELEYAVPAASGLDCAREVAEAIRTRNIAGVYPLEFRFIAADDCWLSPFYERDSVSISVHQYHRQSHDELFGVAEAIFRRYAGRPHWGKLHTLRAADFSRLYPRFDEYRALRRRLDPRGKLLNAHLKDIFGV